MNRPAKILNGLIAPQKVLPSLVRPEALRLHLQTAQHPHPSRGQGVALHPFVAQGGGQRRKVLRQDLGHLLKLLRLRPVNGQLLQGRPRLSGLLLVLAVREAAPPPPRKARRWPPLWSAWTLSCSRSCSSSLLRWSALNSR